MRSISGDKQRTLSKKRWKKDKEEGKRKCKRDLRFELTRGKMEAGNRLRHSGSCSENRKIKCGRIDHEGSPAGSLHILTFLCCGCCCNILCDSNFHPVRFFFFWCSLFAFAPRGYRKSVCVLATWGAPQENDSPKWARFCVMGCKMSLQRCLLNSCALLHNANWVCMEANSGSLCRQRFLYCCIYCWPFFVTVFPAVIFISQFNLCINYVGMHPSRLSRAGLHQGRVTAWGGGEACSHENQATTCYLCSSSPAVDTKSQWICRDNKFTFTIHTADRLVSGFVNVRHTG